MKSVWVLRIYVKGHYVVDTINEANILFSIGTLDFKQWTEFHTQTQLK